MSSSISEDDDIEINGFRTRVWLKVQEDLMASEFRMALFSAALLSYRQDSCVRPFPSFLKDELLNGEEARRFDKLGDVFKVIPTLSSLNKEGLVLSEECWHLLDWILSERIFSVTTRSCEVLKELQEKTGKASFSLEPDYVFEIKYNSVSSQRFDVMAGEYGVKYGYHGSRMDNFYSIVSNGLQVHMTKNGLFGEGIYLSEDLAVTAPYMSSGAVWLHSHLGNQLSCIAVCEIIDHPNVRCQVDDTKRSPRRASVRNSELGDVPEKYFVVTSSDLVRVKYVLVFAEKAQPRRRAANDWFFARYPVASILLLYGLFLIFMGVWKTRPVQRLLHKHWVGGYLEDG